MKHCAHCAEEIPDLTDLLNKLRRKADDGGWFEISDCSADVLRRYIDALEECIDGEFGADKSGSIANRIT